MLLTGEEDELLNIDEDMLNENASEPPYAQVNKPDKKHKHVKQAPHGSSSSLDHSALDQQVPSPVRMHSLPAGSGSGSSKRASTGGASGGHAVNKSQTLPVRFKEARLSRIRRVIRDELEAAFNDYEQPVGASGPLHGNATSRDEDTEVLMAGVGFKTMTRLMREEIQKYKDLMSSPTRLDRSSPVIEVDNDIYEDHYQTLDHFGHAPPPPSINNGGAGAAAGGAAGASGGAVGDTYKSIVPPPLPPRNKSHGAGGGGGGGGGGADDAWSMNMLAESLKVPGQRTDMALQESIKKLSQLLGNDWKRLAKALPLAPNAQFVDIRVREIEKMYLGNSEKQALVMLMEWRLNKGATADVDALIVGLRKCGMKSMVAKVEKITQEFTA